ncbi:AAA family ATPase [Nocardia brasiliensis]
MHSDRESEPMLDARVCAELASATAALPDPGVVVVCGFPASGKSTAAKWLAAQLGAVVLDKDSFVPRLECDVMARLTGDSHDRDSEVYRSLVSPGIYEALTRTGFRIGAAHHVVLDGPFLSVIRAACAASRSLAQYLRDVAQASDAVAVQTIWIDSPEREIRARMLSRGAERDISKLADWETYRKGVLDSGIREIAHRVVGIVIAN